jgi:hypothetical protein
MLNEIYLGISKNVCEQFKAEFKTKTTNFQRFECLWNNQSAYINNRLNSYLTIVNKNQNTAKIKDQLKSASLKKEGNELFEKRQLNDAIDKYNSSLRYSVFGDENKALILADRSIVFFELNEFQLCLNDIESVLQNDHYPQNLNIELYERKLECLYRLNRSEDAADFIDGLDSELKEVFSKIKERIVNVEVGNPKTLISIPFIGNKLIPGASAKLTLDNTVTGGK